MNINIKNIFRGMRKSSMTTYNNNKLALMEHILFENYLYF